MDASLAAWIAIAAVAVAAAALVAIPVGTYVAHRRRFEFVAITIGNLGRALPSFGILAIFFVVPFVARLPGDIGFWPTLIAMFFLGVPPILTNTYVGVRGVDEDTVESARGMGMTELQIVRRVELPLALPLVLGGIRTSAVNVVATATIAPLASVNTLGTPIINANVYGPDGRLAAAILVALLTLAAYWGLGLVQRALTSKGISLAAGREPRGADIRFPLRRRPRPT